MAKDLEERMVRGTGLFPGDWSVIALLHGFDTHHGITLLCQCGVLILIWG